MLGPFAVLLVMYVLPSRFPNGGPTAADRADEIANQRIADIAAAYKAGKGRRA
ncbi:hypothetical protein BH11PLA1_BH11PLA1_00980 [soil metagenome]